MAHAFALSSHNPVEMFTLLVVSMPSSRELSPNFPEIITERMLPAAGEKEIG
ncbi:MAG: hypothetical protein J1E80_00580 [Desulfovibrionaceae bacterium]|nr:hypothetical protein [Desulfovibrionaceae bacterium]